MGKTLDEILSEFNTSAPRSSQKMGACIAIWLTPEYKEKYDRLQGMSNRQFCKKLRELIQAAIDMTEARA